MRITEGESLSDRTTLKVGGPARFSLTIDTEADIEAALAFVRERGLPFVVLGEGSNVLAPDEGYAGALLRMRIPGIAYESDGESTVMRVGAGVVWDELVRACAARGLWGLENLAGIPGTVGAAPVQNIGAYGAEVRNVVRSVDAYDVRTHALRTFANDECGFAYRDSRFKHEPELIITSVTFALTASAAPQIEYADLIAAREAGTDLASPGAIGEAVRRIRARKFPDLRTYGTAGSFFKNPIIDEATYEWLSERYRDQAAPYGGIPRYPVPGQVKIPLAFILDKILGLRGYRNGHAFLFDSQPLVIVADHGAHASDIERIAQDIEARIQDATGITIEREVRALEAHETK